MKLRNEVRYRMTKWIVCNLLKKDLITQEEAEQIGIALAREFNPPMEVVKASGLNTVEEKKEAVST